MSLKLLGAALCLAATLPLSARAAETAEAVYINGKVYTADAGDSVVQGFAVAGGRFVAVGSDAEVRQHVGPGTRVVDLQGRFVSPGLADGHFHNEGGGSGIDLSHARSLAELLTIVANAAAAAAPGALLVSNSDWHEAQLKEQRLPTAAELDQAAPHNPVVLVRGGHSIILSAGALKQFDITPDTPVPAGGQISRDKDGALTGEIFDTAKALVPLPAPKPLAMDDIVATQAALNAYGITAVRIPGSYKGDMLDALRLWRQAAADQTLTLRYTVYMPGFSFRTAQQVDDAIARWGVKQDEGDDFVRIGGIKLIVDGGFEGGHLSRPYLEPYGQGGTYAGLTVSPPSAYEAVVREINRKGWRPTTHAVGDAAVDEVLTAYEKADADTPIAGKRWAIEHAFVVRPDLVDRMKKINLMVSAQDHLYLAAPVLKKYWGWDLASEVTPVKTFLDAGLLVAGGTDSPVIPFNPFWELYHFASRDTISDGVYGTDQKIASRALLLRLDTINFARLIGEDDHRGSIEPGKLADFAILTDDFLTVPVEKIQDMKALATYVGGREVYRDPSYR
ncbi:amidohydrolase [Inquilinus sp.]|uniref:amidohydrolase n=1 Tax=Inquilinus sp. TaxID=1932117 RepID=UPI003783C0E5